MDLQQNITEEIAGMDQDCAKYSGRSGLKIIKHKRVRDQQASASCSSKQQKLARRSSTAPAQLAAAAAATRNTSKYRGVTRHRWTGRYEAHLWDKNSWNQSRSKKGRQVYLGAYDDEDTAAHAYDLAALKYWGPDTILNFPLEMYDKEIEDMQNHTREEYIASLRRKSNGFSRGVSKYRGVARHHHNGRWEARIGRVYGNKYLYLGTYSTQEEAAIAYDIAAIQYRGLNAVTNFDMSNYLRWMKPGQLVTDPCTDIQKHQNINNDNNDSAAIINSRQLQDATSANPNFETSMPVVQAMEAATVANNAHFNKHHHQRLMQVCAETIMCSTNISQTAEQIDHPHMQKLMMMQLENILGTSDTYDSHLQDQASATCSAPAGPPPSFHGSSHNLAETASHAQQYLYLPSTYAKPGAGDDAPQLNTAYHLDKLMAEYNELLQSSSPQEILDKGTFSTIMDTLADTASSSTSSSVSTAPVHVLDNKQLNHIIKPGGYVEGLLSPREEFFKYVEPMFDMSDMVLGKTDSICSSNDLSSVQELVACSMSDPSCNNGMYPIHFNCVSPMNYHGLMLDNSLSNSLASLLPSLNTFHQQYLQR